MRQFAIKHLCSFNPRRGSNKHSSIVVFFGLALLWMSLATAQEIRVMLAWDPPTTNEDGTPLTDLAGYRIYASDEPIDDGAIPRTLTLLADVRHNVLTTEVTYTPAMRTGRMYVRATAYDLEGNESKYSNEVSRIYDFLAPQSIIIRIIPPKGIDK